MPMRRSKSKRENDALENLEERTGRKASVSSYKVL